MGWFDEQIKQRLKEDNSAFEDSFLNMAGIVMGKDSVATLQDDLHRTRNAIEEILKYYGVKPRDIPDNITDLNEQLEFLMRPSGIMRRRVELTDKWYDKATGAFLAFRKDGSVAALIPKGLSGYSVLDEKTGKRVRIDEKNADEFEVDAYCFYRPLPLRALKIKDLLKFMVESLAVSDFVFIGLASLLISLIGMLTPKISNLIFSEITDNKSVTALGAATVMLVCATASSSIFGITRNIMLQRIQVKVSVGVQSATMMRVLSLPADFFKAYSAGDLADRLEYLNSACTEMINISISAVLTTVFSLVYIPQIFSFAPTLAGEALIILLLTFILTVVTTIIQTKVSSEKYKSMAKESGIRFSLISGIQKIKLSGAQKRAFSKWANCYCDTARSTYEKPLILKINTVISSAITLIGTIVLYYSAVKSGVSVADYYSFNVSFGIISGSFLSLSSVVIVAAGIYSVFGMIEPILKAVPEVSEEKRVIQKLSGGIELNNITFRYTPDMPLVLDGISFKIRPGQYVAIVGKTGCGKSTLMRILLGLETPDKGAVYYDGNDMSKIDLKSLRRKIGVVMQNGKLFTGDIYSNIVISAPQLSMDDAWEAAELAGIADDIREMPMGMFTMISEGSGGISGGQRQRLMIARAIAPKPKILMFDEATSALDNITQKKVSQALDSLKCTRIVIAHRLSTIMQCDRIIVLDKGKIVEDGSYEQLIANQGFFADLVERQRLVSES
jgi:NHLM bacteriocin system ABC transporter ATP-binding protein